MTKMQTWSGCRHAGAVYGTGGTKGATCSICLVRRRRCCLEQTLVAGERASLSRERRSVLTSGPNSGLRFPALMSDPGVGSGP
jgi:hypothetical protein